MAGESRSVTECLRPRVRVNALNRKLMTSLLLIPQSPTLFPRCRCCLQFSSQEADDEWDQEGGASVRAQYVQPRASLTRFPAEDAEFAQVWRCYIHCTWSVVTLACKLLSVTSTSSLQRCSCRPLCLGFNQSQVASRNQSTKHHNYHLRHTAL